MLISAVIITLNEEANISRCLASLQGVADEVIIVDSFSKDKTEEISKSFSFVRFYQQEWLGYSAQKNYANALATHDTILSIDADEALSEELTKSILQIKQSESESSKVYEVSRLTNYCGSWIKHCGWYPDKKIRIFSKSTIKWQGDFVHETLSLPENAEIIHLNGDLLHYSYNTSFDHLERLNKYSSLAAKEAFKKGKKSSICGIWFRPKWRFFRDYILKGGFLDGYAGYQVCKMSAYVTFAKYIKLREYNQKGSITK